MEPRCFEFDDWAQRFEAGDPSAATELVDTFYDRLVGLAKKRLVGVPPQIADSEGAVISALRSFFSGVERGQFSQIGSENDLWRVLATITARKAMRQMRVHWKQSGEGGRIDRARQLSRLPDRRIWSTSGLTSLASARRYFTY